MDHKEHRIASRVAALTLRAVLAGWGGIMLYTLFRSWQTNMGATLHKSYLYPVFLVISAVGFLVCLALLKTSPDTQINAALVCASTCLTLYLLEGVLLLLTLNMSSGALRAVEHDTFKERVKLARKMDMFFDTRTPLEVVADLNAQQVQAYPAMLPTYRLEHSRQHETALEFLPLGGISGVTTVLCNETGDYAMYQSDGHGFNNPPGVFQQRSVDLVLVGDSFTHGYCVQQGEDIAGQLRRLGWSVINLGMGANGPLIELAALKEFAEPVQPDTVLWVYYEGNDLVDLERDAEFALLRRYLERDFSQDLRRRQAEVDASLRQHAQRQLQQEQWVRQQKEPAVLLLKFLKLWRVRNLFGLAPVPVQRTPPYRPRHPVADSLHLLRQVLVRAQRMTAAWGGRLYVVYLPSWERYAKRIDDTEFHRDEVLSLVRQLHIPLIDMHPVLRNHDDPLSLIPFRGRGHFTPAGYQLIAEAIAQALNPPPNDESLGYVQSSEFSHVN